MSQGNVEVGSDAAFVVNGPHHRRVGPLVVLLDRGVDHGHDLGCLSAVA
jgi:hypothetical protein